MVNIIYFAGGNRLNVLRKIMSDTRFEVSHIFIADIETYQKQYIDYANANHVKISISAKYNLEESFVCAKEDILLSVGYRYIIPKSVYEETKYAINIHPSLLPKYKGAYSGFAIIENAEKETGITVHFLDQGVDTGDIILQHTIDLTCFDTIKSMSAKIAAVEPEIVIKGLELLLNQNFERVQQQKTSDDFIYNKKRVPEDSCIDPSKPLIELYNKIRACDQDRFPAYFYIDGKRINIRLEM